MAKITEVDMSGKTAQKALVSETIPSEGGKVSAIASANAPFLYFEEVLTYGLVGAGDVANLALAANRIMPSTDGSGTVTDRVIVAHLRTNLAGLGILREAIDKIFAMRAPSDRPPN